MGDGFRGTTEVQVTVEDGYIADITVLSFRDDREFFHKAQSAVINEILTEQTIDVSTVSGATFSSNSIMDAVAGKCGAGSDRGEQPAGGESGSGAEGPGSGGSGSGAEGPGAGGGNGPGFGQHDIGGHGRGGRGGRQNGR